MNENKILKLLKSTNEGDVLIGLSLLAKLEDPRAFIKTHGEILPGQADNDKYTHYGKRYRIITNCFIGDENIYYKIKKDLYILFGPEYRDLSECYSNYSEDLKVINP